MMARPWHMELGKVLTTTIGAYPKPDSVALETWFGTRTRRPIEGYGAALAEMGAEAEGLFDRAK